MPQAVWETLNGQQNNSFVVHVDMEYRVSLMPAHGPVASFVQLRNHLHLFGAPATVSFEQ